MNDLERRFTPGRVELRLGATEKHTFGGYAAKFDTQSRNLGGFIETIKPGFFNRSRSRDWPDVLARYNHDDNRLLGTTAAGTLRLHVDEVGLFYEVDPPQSRQDVYELVERGDVNRSSFAFIADEDEWTASDQGFPMRSLINGRLIDVAPVNSPAYEDTSVGLRSLARKFDAEVDEVRKLAADNQLMRFFKRTDKDGQPVITKKRSAQMRLAQAMAIKDIPPTSV